MASRIDRSRVDGEGGFATPAAAAISLAIALIVSAVVTLAVTTLHHERARLAALRQQSALEGAAAEAELTLMGSPSQGPVRWSLPVDGGVEVVAEPEAAKLGLSETAALADENFRPWQVAVPTALRARLAALAADTDQTANLIPGADPSAIWRLCARSAISPYGAAKTLPATQFSAPILGVGAGRVGQLWRIRLATADGWVEDRIVRFTGSSQRPVSVASDWFGRGPQMGDACANLGA
jgi:hypothetical protein